MVRKPFVLARSRSSMVMKAISAVAEPFLNGDEQLRRTRSASARGAFATRGGCTELKYGLSFV